MTILRTSASRSVVAKRVVETLSSVRLDSKGESDEWLDLDQLAQEAGYEKRRPFLNRAEQVYVALSGETVQVKPVERISSMESCSLDDPLEVNVRDVESLADVLDVQRGKAVVWP